MSTWARDNLSHLTEAEVAALYAYLNASQFPPETILPSIIRSPGFIPVGQLPTYLASMIIRVSDAPELMCISV
jgi:hypothetical protein